MMKAVHTYLVLVALVGTALLVGIIRSDPSDPGLWKLGLVPVGLLAMGAAWLAERRAKRRATRSPKDPKEAVSSSPRG